MNYARFAVLGNYNEFIVLQLQTRHTILVSDIILRDPSSANEEPKDIHVTPLTLFVALLLPGSISSNPGWIDRVQVARLTSAYKDAAKSKSKKSKGGAHQGPAAGGSTSGKGAGTTAPPTSSTRAADLDTSTTESASGTDIAVSRFQLFGRQLSLDVALPVVGRPSRKSIIPPSNISVSAYNDESFLYRSNVMSLHGLEYNSLPDFVWKAVHFTKGDSGSEPSDSPVTPSSNLPLMVNPLITDVNNPTLSIQMAKKPRSTLEYTLDVFGGVRLSRKGPSPSFEGDSVRSRIVLKSFISHGRLWDAYHADYYNLDLGHYPSHHSQDGLRRDVQRQRYDFRIYIYLP